MKQKLTLLLLCFTMVVSLCAVFSLGTAAATSPVAPEVDTTPPEGTDTWNGTTAASDPLFAGGDGTPENPWQIDTAARLAYLGTLIKNNGDYADDSYVLTANINMDKKNMEYAIGNTNVFKGIFDGGNFTIYNLGDKMFQTFNGTLQNLNLVNATGCLVEGVSSGATLKIKNCNFHINTTKLAFVFNGSNIPNNTTVTLEDIVVSGQLKCSSTSNCGVFARETKANTKLSMTNCVNYANVTGGGNVGGFIGAILNAATFTNCFNYGNVTSTATEGAYSVGGFIGTTVSGSHIFAFENCANYGAVTSNFTGAPVDANGYATADTALGGKAHGAGGFFGSTSGSSYANVKLNNCASYGSVTAASGFAGGIIGSFGYNSAATKNQTPSQMNLTDVLVLATVTTATPSSSSDVAGGAATKGYNLYRVYTLNETYMGDSTNTWNKINKKTDCAVYAAGDNGTIALLNAQVEKNNNDENATVTYTAWVDAVLPGATVKYPTLATTPHVLNADLPEYTVTFVGMNGWSESQAVKEGFAAEAPEAPEVEGYVFDKWDVNFNKITSDLTVTAIYKKLHTVTFVGFDGSNLCEPQIIVDGEAATAPEAPEVEGYNYVGWSAEFAVVNSDLTIHALYQIKTYTVTFLGLDDEVLSVQTVEYFAAAVAPDVEEVVGYKFNGWSVAFDYITGDLTVKAIFTSLSDLFAGGLGTEDDPFIISSKEFLNTLVAYINGTETYKDLTAEYFAAAHYRLVEDLDYAGDTWTPIATFSGVFDGNGKTISNIVNTDTKNAYGFFLDACGTVKNLTFKNVNVTYGENKGGDKGILAAKATLGTLNIINCHIVDGKVGGSGNIGMFIGYICQNAVASFKNCTVNGAMTTVNNGYVGGFVGKIGDWNTAGGTVNATNCTSAVSIMGTGQRVGGFVGGSNQGGVTVTLTNCIFAGKISLESGSAGGFFGQKRNAGTITLNECASYATIYSAAGNAGGVVGWFDQSNVALKVNDCAIYGNISTVSGAAGGVVGGYYNNQTQTKIQNLFIFATVSCGEGGNYGAFTGILGGDKNNSSLKNIYVLNETSENTVFYTSAIESTQNMVIDETVITTIRSINALPEGFTSDLWTIGTVPMVSGVSVTLGNSITVNVFSEVGIILKAHQSEGLYVNGAYVGEGEKAIVGGVDYTKYVFDSFEIADMDKALAISLLGEDVVQKNYAITTYLANTYKNYANLAALVEAIALYGNAAQLADEQEPTVLSSFVAAAGIELPEDYSFEAYVAEKYSKINLKTNNTSAVGMGINLSGTIDPIFYVADGITKVEVEIYGKTTTIEVIEGVAQFYGLNATSLNNTMQVTFYAGDEVVSTQRTSVACYIEDALAREGFLTEGQTVLAQALAVYMRAARDYMGLN